MGRSFKKYLGSFAAVAAAAMLGVGALNVVVDPYRTFRLVSTPQLDAHKASRAGRISKAEQLRRGPWDTVVLGSSRVDCGIDPDHPAWPTPNTFNCGLTGLNFTEEARVYDYVERVARPSTVVLCLDFFHFQDAAPVSGEFNESRFNPDLSLLSYWADALWGSRTTSRSLATLAARRRHAAPEYSPHGLRIKPMAPPGQGGRVAFEQYVARSVEPWRQMGAWAGDAQCMAGFARILRSAADHHVRLIVVIMPVHALDMELARIELGSTQPFDDWRRRLVAAVDAYRHDRPAAPPVPLWDFTAYRGRAAEPIPPPGEDRPMTWYWEPSHFRKALGDLLIERISGRGPDDFGRLIDTGNIESYLAGCRADREVFLTANAADVARLERAVRAAGK